MTRRSKGPAKSTTPSRSLDRVDRLILRALQSDGRLAITDLARAVHLTNTPCFERVRRLERDGFITGYAALLNPRRLGVPLLAFVQVRVDRTTADVFTKFQAAVQALDEVAECHMIAGGFDYLIKIRVADMTAYRKFLGEALASLPGVAQTNTYVVMEEIKATHRLHV